VPLSRDLRFLLRELIEEARVQGIVQDIIKKSDGLQLQTVASLSISKL
jgi:hypothetical protein